MEGWMVISSLLKISCPCYMNCFVWNLLCYEYFNISCNFVAYFIALMLLKKFSMTEVCPKWHCCVTALIHHSILFFFNLVFFLFFFFPFFFVFSLFIFKTKIKMNRRWKKLRNLGFWALVFDLERKIIHDFVR